MSNTTPLLDQALLGVLRNAQQGRLPPFALSLGLSAPSFAVLRTHIKIAATTPVKAPALFDSLAAHLMRYRAPDVDAQEAEWLAHAIACAGYGHNHLWQELGVEQRETVSQLLKNYFPDFFFRNTTNMRWKKFLFAELGASLGQADLLPPHCEGCDQFRICFPED